MKRNLERILIICTVLTLIFIWGHSALPGNISSQESGFVMRLLTPFLELFAGKGNVTEHLVRKLAHFTEFSVLGVEAGLYFGIFRRRKNGNIWTGLVPVILCCSFAAVIDETIQIFSGRGPAVSDIWIDTSGAFAGAVIVLLILFLREKRINRS